MLCSQSAETPGVSHTVRPHFSLNPLNEHAQSEAGQLKHANRFLYILMAAELK